MVAEISLVSVSLATVCIESFLYGIFFILFLLSTYLLFTRHQLTSPKRSPLSILATPFFSATLCIFVTITAHWILTFIRLFEAFVLSGQTPLDFYGDLKQITEVVKTGFLMASLVIGDSMIIYRLWIVWSYNKAVVVLPLCTLIGLTVCGVGITFQFTQYSPGQNVFLSEAGRWITSDCVFTLCTNLYCSVLIAWRIYKCNSSSRQYGGQNLNSVLAIIVESAAIYTSWTIFFFASYQSQSNLQFIAVDAWPAMSGIAFMFINVRVGLGWAQKANPELVNISGSRSKNSHSSRGMASDTFVMQPLSVNITKVVDDDQYRLSPKVSGDGGSFGKSVVQ